MNKLTPQEKWALTHPKRARANNILGMIRHRSKASGMECDLTLDWLHEKFKKGVCEITGLPFDFKPPDKKGAKPPFTPSVDRIDPTKGYTKDNCQVILWAVNRAKGEHSYDLMYHWARRFVAAYEKWIQDNI